MKLSILLILAVSIQVNARTYGQTVTLSLKNTSLEKVFVEIEKQIGYHFIYGKEQLQNIKNIDLQVTNQDIEKVLLIVFKDQPLTYAITKNYIVIKQKEEAKKKGFDVVLSPPSPGDVKGKVSNENGDPAASITVTVKGTHNATSTDISGEFVLYNVDANATLVFSGTNIETYEVKLNGRTEIAVNLKIKVSSLDEVQVIAYGTTTKRLNTGNVTTVIAADIEKQPINNPLLALQGRVSGLEITQTTGMSGGGVKAQIRGQNSIRQGIDPLFIIDGVPYTSQTMPGYYGVNLLADVGLGSPFNFINPADIESIEVLKDADATSIYGTRGANGVILITTKKGKAGRTKADINIQNGLGKVSRRMNLLNTRQYLDMRYEAFKNDNATPNPNVDYDLTLWDTTRNTDWQKVLIGGTAKFSDIQASVSGGNTNTQYLIGSGYHKETTVFPGHNYDEKASVHVNIISSSISKKFKISFSGIYTIDNNKLSAFNYTEMAMQLPPDAPLLYNSDGSLNWAPNAAGISTWPNSNGNPAATSFSKYNLKTYNLVSNAYLSYQVIPGLQVRTSMGYTNMQMNQFSALPFASIDPSLWHSGLRYSYFTNNNIQSWIIEPQVNYIKKISKGFLSILLGATIQQNKNSGQLLAAYGFNTDLVMEDIKAATNVIVGSNTNALYKYNAAFTRLNYNWQDRYLINLTIRRDGTSRFGPANQFHNFGAIGTGWIFSKERFIHQKLQFVSFGKLRASYGTTGSDQIGDYTFFDLYTTLPGVAVPYQGAIGISPNTIFTPDLAWEETKKLEAAIELGFLNDRILFTSSFYLNRSGNQLVGYSLPAITGFTSVTKNLPALVQNKGWEFELTTINIKSKKFNWSSSFNLTFNNNKLLSGAPGLSSFYQSKIGNPLNSVFVYHFREVDPITGMNQFTDINGNPTTNPNALTDKKSLIDLTPKYYGGLQNTISYKGFLLEFFFQFVKRPFAQEYLYNYIPGFFSTNSAGSNQPLIVFQRWQQPGDVKPNQKFNQNLNLVSSYSNSQQSDLIYGDASYISLKNLSFSWIVPEKWLEMVHLQNAKIYTQGQNLLLITKYKGLSPETLGSSLILPPLRIITVGIQISM